MTLDEFKRKVIKMGEVSVSSFSTALQAVEGDRSVAPVFGDLVRYRDLRVQELLFRDGMPRPDPDEVEEILRDITSLVSERGAVNVVPDSGAADGGRTSGAL